MWYDITHWKTKLIKDLAIPLQAIRDLPYVEITEIDGNILASGAAECFELSGSVADGIVHVKAIDYSAEGSGHQWDNFKRMLSKSTGELIARQVWEGGDSITLLTVRDGSVSDEEIDL